MILRICADLPDCDLLCSHTRSIDADEGSGQNVDRIYKVFSGGLKFRFLVCFSLSHTNSIDADEDSGQNVDRI